MSKTWVYRVLLAFDLFVCACIWRIDDVTISAETGLAMQRPNPPLWARMLNGFLNWIRPGHCAAAILDDIERAKNAITYLSSKP
jgi:hypothetical protein